MHSHDDHGASENAKDLRPRLGFSFSRVLVLALASASESATIQCISRQEPALHERSLVGPAFLHREVGQGFGGLSGLLRQHLRDGGRRIDHHYHRGLREALWQNTETCGSGPLSVIFSVNLWVPCLHRAAEQACERRRRKHETNRSHTACWRGQQRLIAKCRGMIDQTCLPW